MGGKGDEDAETMATILHHLCLIKSKIYEDMKTRRIMIMVYIWDNPFISCISVTRHQIVKVAIVANLVYTYLTRIRFK